MAPSKSSTTPEAPAAPPVEPEPAVIADPVAPAEIEVPVMSAGVASDLDMLGHAGDPSTGGRWERDADSGVLTYTDRAGRSVTVER